MSPDVTVLTLRFYLPQMTGFMENCFAKGVMSGVMGFGMGGLFGMFMASVSALRTNMSLPL